MPNVLRVKVPVGQFKKLKTDKKFILIMRLCRFINQLSFCEDTYLAAGNEKNPRKIRQRHNSFLFSCAVLYEALKFYPNLGKEFLTYKSYKQGFAKLSKHPDFDFVKNKVINIMRNEFIHHVDEGPFVETLKMYDGNRSADFLLTSSPTIEETYYQLADELALNYIYGGHTTEEKLNQHIIDLVTKIMRLNIEFQICAHKLIAEYVDRKYWKLDEKEI